MALADTLTALRNADTARGLTDAETREIAKAALSSLGALSGSWVAGRFAPSERALLGAYIDARDSLIPHSVRDAAKTPCASR